MNQTERKDDLIRNMISVCMATYNGEEYIEEQLRSILSQIGDGDEVVISDDSSTDNTLDVAESLHDSRIRILRGNSFHSPIFNFENALMHAQGDHIYLADQDDIWEADKVSVIERELETCDLVNSDATVIDAHGDVLYDSFYELRHSGKGYLKNLCRNSYVGCCMAFRREVLMTCLPFPRYIPMHDSYIGLVAELNYRTRFVPDKLIRFRRHQGNASPTVSGSTFSMWTRFLHRERLLRASLFQAARKRRQHEGKL